MSKSLYETLEVSPNATAEEIKKSYRRLARKYHPDINKEVGAEDKFKEINAAYEILSDEQKRKQYDQFGDAMFGGQNFSDFARQNVNLDDILNSIFGSSDIFDGLRSSRSGFRSSGFGGGGFGNFSNFDRSGTARQSHQNLDVNAVVTIPFTVSINGGLVGVNVNNEQFDIKIPAGVKSGEVLRVKGKGRSSGAIRGDVLLKIEVTPHPEYIREHDDLTTTVNIPLKIALFGGTVSTKILTKDENVSIKIPQNAKNGQKFRLKGMGVKNRKNGVAGDLYLKANIVLPNVESLSPSLQESLQKELPDSL